MAVFQQYTIIIFLIIFTFHGANCQTHTADFTTTDKPPSRDNHGQQQEIAGDNKQTTQIQQMSKLIELLQQSQLSWLQVIEQQSQQNQILANMAALLEKHDRQLSNLSTQQTVQNQILSDLTNQQTIQNQIFGEVNNQQTVQNQMLSTLTHQQRIDNQEQSNTFNKLIQMQNVGNRIEGGMLTLLHKHDKKLENLENITHQQTIQNNILNTMVSLLDAQNKTFSNSCDVHDNTQSTSHSTSEITGQETPTHIPTGNASSFQNYTERSQLTTSSTPTVHPSSRTPTSVTPARDCSDIGEEGSHGIYTSQPSEDSDWSFDVLCNLETSGEAWIVFQRRFDGSVNFYRPWQEYVDGFGDLTGEHWLGLNKLQTLTKSGSWKLRVDIEDLYGNTYYAEYSSFAIGSEYYKLTFNGYSGNAGDHLSYLTSNEIFFSTYDNDNDGRYGYNCAQSTKSAWWLGSVCYNDRVGQNPNGLYIGSPGYTTDTAMKWYDRRLRKSEMKIRRI